LLIIFITFRTSFLETSQLALLAVLNELNIFIIDTKISTSFSFLLSVEFLLSLQLFLVFFSLSSLLILDFIDDVFIRSNEVIVFTLSLFVIIFIIVFVIDLDILLRIFSLVIVEFLRLYNKEWIKLNICFII